MLTLTIKSTDKISLSEKRKYIDALFIEDMKFNTGNGEKRNQGFLFKFASAIGFRKLMSTTDHSSIVRGPEVPSPAEYISPEFLLYETIRTPMDGETVAEFIFEDKVITHSLDEYTYNPADIAEKAQNYFQKVFPDLVIELIQDSEKKPRDFVEDFIEYCYRNLDPRGFITLEWSSERFLTEEEIQRIEDTLSPLLIPKVKVYQCECNTCIKHTNGERPIHVGLEYIETK